MARRARKARRVARLDYLVASTQQRQDRVRALARKEAREDHRDFGTARTRQGHPIYDASYAEAWQELTGEDLWNSDKWTSGRRTGNPDHTGSKLFARGAKVKFVDRFGNARSGKIVFSNPGGWLTLNMGGPHGTPQVIHQDDVIDWGGSRSKKKGNPMRFYLLSPRAGNPRRRSRRRRSTRRRRNYASDYASPWVSNPRRRTRRRRTSRRRNPTRRRRGPSRAASRKGGRKAARVMRRNRWGQFIGRKRRARNPRRRRSTRRRRSYRRYR